MDYEISTLLAIVLGPLLAVLITLWHQDRSSKRASKEALFRTLMAFRKTHPPTADLTGALNLIDVIFYDHREVVDLWHELYSLLYQPQVPQQQRDHKYLELLSTMAGTLGYRDLKQTDIDKFYVAEVNRQLFGLNLGVQAELLRVLRNTQALAVIPITTSPEDASPVNAQSEQQPAVSKPP